MHFIFNDENNVNCAQDDTNRGPNAWSWSPLQEGNQALPWEASFINTTFAHLHERSRMSEDGEFIILPLFHVHQSSSSLALEGYNPPSQALCNPFGA